MKLTRKSLPMSLPIVPNSPGKSCGGQASATIVLILILINLPSVFAQATASNKNAAMTPLQLVQSGRYSEALPYFKSMANTTPRDPSINYYLGLCAESVYDYALAELAFCRIVVATQPASPFVPLAQKQLHALPHQLEPQCCLYKNQTRLWDRSAYPLRIFISAGRTLTNHLSGGPTTPEEYKQVIETVQTNLARMPVAPSYKPSYAGLVVEGIRGWDWAAREKLFSYTFVRDPRSADIVIVFCEQKTGYTHFPYEKGQPMVVWIAIASAGPEHEEFDRNCVRANAGHEFGHCLGLGHSSVELDLMFPITHVANEADRRSPDTIASANDKASLRALFSMPADLVLYPVK
jgi:hypothetical protein